MFPFCRHLSTLCLILLFPLLAQADWFSSSTEPTFLPVDEAFQASAWHDGETLQIGFEIADGYYLYRHRFALDSADDAPPLGELQLPPGEAKTDEFLGDVQVFHDRVVLEAPLEDETSGPMSIELTFQGCAEAGLCYPPETLTLKAAQSEAPATFRDMEPNAPSRATADKPADASLDPASRQGNSLSADLPASQDGHFSSLMHDASLPLVLGLFLLAGLGLTFTPCVLPMVPILASIIVGQNPSRGRAFALSASYVAGMAITYSLVGVLMGLFGAGLNLQARLQSPPVLIGFALLFVVFALAMFDAFQLKLSSRLSQKLDVWQDKARRSGPLGLALAGALSVLVVSPCVSAPLAGALVFISSTGDAAMGGAALLALALGMGLPLLLVGTFGVTLLPRTGAWMNGVKYAFGVLLLGVAIWLVERLLPGPLVLMLWALLASGTAMALGVWNPGQPQGWPRARQALGMLLLVWAITLVIGAARGNHDPLQPLARSASPAQVAAGPSAESPDAPKVVTSLDALTSSLATSRKPVMVNITADWCISCQLMEREVFPDPEVRNGMQGFQRIDVDVTASNAESRRILDHFQLFGPPSLLFFDGTQELRQARIQGEVEAATLASHLETLKAWQQGHSPAP